MSSPPEFTVESLVRQAELLSPEQRSQLLERLEAMQEKGHRPPPGSDIDADQWIRTIRRRADEMRQGTAKTVSLAEAVEEAKRRIR
jgi:hypothetical protein